MTDRFNNDHYFNPAYNSMTMQDVAAIELMKYACDSLWRLPEEFHQADTLEKKYDLAAKLYGGGGHKNAAGFMLQHPQLHAGLQSWKGSELDQMGEVVK